MERHSFSSIVNSMSKPVGQIIIDKYRKFARLFNSLQHKDLEYRIVKDSEWTLLIRIA